MYKPPLNDIEYSLKRLDLIMSRRRLSFNPYTVTDQRLMEIVNTTGWGGQYDITQIVKVHFTRLKETGDSRIFNGIYMQVANSGDEISLPVGFFRHGIVANDTLHREFTVAGSRTIRHYEDIEWLVGKTFFVSRTIRGTIPDGAYRVAYRLNKLTGTLHRDATIVRTAMCQAKIEMLERMRDHPECNDYLSCDKTLIDYSTRINRAIYLIRHFHEVSIS